ncbi:trypsin-1 [Eurytemora carolleeae]|uniref:trypsin-1 n=1 Tax=Eurytemora carolleeae TaxID=1294199 RepID=UPI000C7760AF|nr:trypsin-1 [Eurytemora carolleeae]|eukprot:XP_023333602.1 trypsin-1-like [Eurytemora affinis]
MMLLPVSRILLSILCVSSVSGCLPPNFFQALFQPQVIVTTTTTTTTTSSISTGTTTSTSSSSSSSVSTEEPLTGKLRNATGCGLLGTPPNKRQLRKALNKRKKNKVKNPEDDTRIVGGVATYENEFPWQCSILNRDNSWYGCGASILSCDPVLIITAAHCVYNRFADENNINGEIKVSCGDHFTTGLDTNEKRASVTKITIHESYNSDTFENDIAILHVSSGITCSQGKIWPACLPNAQTYSMVGWTDAYVSGWGTTSEGGQVSDILRKVQSPIVSDSTCKAFYGSSEIKDNMICAGLAEGGVDACQGDSGGPLVARGSTAVGYSLVGVVSWGNGCARPGYYGVYAEVSKFLTWIEYYMD